MKRVYGIYYGPGEDTEKTKRLRREFRNELKEVDIELVNENSNNKTDQEEDERIAESIYQSGRRNCEFDDIEYLCRKMGEDNTKN